MLSGLIVIGAMLAGQIAAGQEDYRGSRITGQGGARNTGSGNNSATGTPPINSPSTPVGDAAASPAVSSPYLASPPPGFGTQPLEQKQSPATGYQAPPGSPNDASTKPATDSQATAMMKAMLAAPRDSQLRGEPVTLLQVVSGARSRGEQTQRVEAYWDLCSSAADYYLGLHEQDELRQLATGVSRPGTTFQDAEKELSVRVGTSLRAARASQLRLANLMGRGGSNLPLPSDPPHCGSFTTNYEQIFAHRSSPEAQELAALLPLRYAELKDAALDVTRDQDWFNGIASARSDTSDGTASLRALKLFALSRRAFVQIVRDYNRRIARYAELAMPGPMSAEKLSGMLIKRAGSTTATRSASPTLPPSRTSSGVENGPPRTFVENWTSASGGANANTPAKRDEGVQPASATQDSSRQERSLLVPLH